MNSVAVQITKIIVGAVVALGCLAVLLFLLVKGVPLDPNVLTIIAAGIVGGGATSVHGALNTPAPKDPSAP